MFMTVWLVVCSFIPSVIFIPSSFHPSREDTLRGRLGAEWEVKWSGTFLNGLGLLPSLKRRLRVLMLVSSMVKTAKVISAAALQSYVRGVEFVQGPPGYIPAWVGCYSLRFLWNDPDFAGDYLTFCKLSCSGQDGAWHTGISGPHGQHLCINSVTMSQGVKLTMATYVLNICLSV